jgi:hypothetical protein
MALEPDWMDDPDQQLIDETLDALIVQQGRVLRDLSYLAIIKVPREDEWSALTHLHGDIELLLPQSSTPL